jgi:hypothetical protein
MWIVVATESDFLVFRFPGRREWKEREYFSTSIPLEAYPRNATRFAWSEYRTRHGWMDAVVDFCLSVCTLKNVQKV